VEVSEKAVTNGTFHVVWTHARVRLWPPRPKTSIAACSVICRRTSAIAKSIAVPARDKLTFACAATDFTTALHADRLAGTGFRTRVAHAFSRYAHRFGRLTPIPHMTIPGEHDLSRVAKFTLETGPQPLADGSPANIIPFPVSRAGRDPLRTLRSLRRTRSPLPGRRSLPPLDFAECIPRVWHSRLHPECDDQSNRAPTLQCLTPIPSLCDTKIHLG
jgi:hypothetical protein